MLIGIFFHKIIMRYAVSVIYRYSSYMVQIRKIYKNVGVNSIPKARAIWKNLKFEYQFLLFPHGQYNFVPYQLSLPTPVELSLTPYDDHAISRHNTMQLIFHEKRFGIPSLFLHISYLTTHLRMQFC